jgi:hypothetical protein
MFIAKKHLSRRTVLRGMGASLALPLLDSMVPAQTPLRQTAASPRTRLACIEMVHGAAGSAGQSDGNHYWSPEKEGTDFDFSYSLEPLAPFREYITIVSGTDARQAEAFAPSEGGADHFRSSAAFLTAVHARQTAGPDVWNGISADQLYAQQSGQDTPLPSIQLGIENIALNGTCAFNYNCVYSETISWASPTDPLPMLVNPRVVFEKLFAQSGQDFAVRRSVNGSVLDGTAPEVSRLQKNLGPQDRGRLNAYLEDIRGIERRIQAIERRNAIAPHRELAAAALGVPDSWEHHVKLMFDLQALAFQTEITRVSAFKMSHDTSNRIFPRSGVKDPFHSLSHHNQNPTLVAEFARLNRYHVSMLPYFLRKLQDTPDGDGNLLDHSLILYGSPMGDSSTHNHRRVPLLLAGHAGGQLRGNLHRVCAAGTPQANCLLTILHKLGVHLASIGDSSGEVAI